MTTTFLPSATTIGAVHLTVRDLGRSAAFYTERLGFAVHDRSDGTLRLGAGEGDLLVLVEDPDARPARGTTGLYHFAVLVPTRGDLARSLARLAASGTRLSGAADHGVSEALYLSDPDGNGIEIYRDRDRDDWPVENGRLAMFTEPLDLDDLFAVADGSPGDAENGLVPGTTIGHVHLHVADLGPARRFYLDLLGFDLMQEYGPSALFVSAGGYHHRVGLNTWQGVGAPPPPPESTGLRHFEIRIPEAEDLERLIERLGEMGVPAEESERGFLVRDPSANAMLLTA